MLISYGMPASSPGWHFSFDDTRCTHPYTRFFGVSAEGSAPKGQIALPIPAGAGEYQTLDLYGWNGSEWVFMPSQIDPNSEQVISDEQDLPEAMAMMQVAPPENTTAGAEVTSGDTLPTQVLPLLAEVSVSKLVLQSDGSVLGEPSPMPDGDFEQWLRVTNVGAITDQASLSSLLSNEGVQDAHIETLVQKAEAGFSGINLDYQEVPGNQTAEFSSFVTSLGDALH